MPIVLPFFLTLVFVSSVDSLSFTINQNSEKCLGEFVSKNALSKGSYVITGQNGNEKSGVTVRITGPSNEVEYVQADATTSKFGFAAKDGGTHRVCFISQANTPRQIELEFLSGVDTTDYSDLARKEHLKPLELQLRKMEDRVEGIHKEMLYQREREEKHRDTNESTNSRVMWFSILTIIVVLATTGFQVQHLHAYLKRIKAL